MSEFMGDPGRELNVAGQLQAAPDQITALSTDKPHCLPYYRIRGRSDHQSIISRYASASKSQEEKLSKIKSKELPPGVHQKENYIKRIISGSPA